MQLFQTFSIVASCRLERAVMRACVPSERKCLSDIHPTQPSVSFTHRATVPYAGAEYAFSIPLNNEVILMLMRVVPVCLVCLNSCTVFVNSVGER